VGAPGNTVRLDFGLKPDQDMAILSI
jgi:hypothetical protein